VRAKTNYVADKQGRSVICRVVQNRIYAPYMTVYLVISLPKIPYVNRIYMVLASPSYLLKRRITHLQTSKRSSVH
jgi:hypothetical protein